MMNFKAIYALYPQTVWADEELGPHDKDGNKIEIDQALVDAWVDPNAYKEQRAAEYPSIPDQLDLLYHGGMDAWKAAITAVKQEFPK